jgi:germination protein M
MSNKTTRKQRRPAKQKRGLNIAAVFLLVLIVGFTGFFMFQALTKNPLPGEGAVSLRLHYYNNQTGRFDVEERFITRDENIEMVRSAVVEWLGGPVSPNLRQNVDAAQEGTIRVSRISNNTFRVSFPEGYTHESEAARTICHASLVLSLTSLEFVYGIMIFVGDQELLKADGTPAGLLTRGNIENEVPLIWYVDKPITLYFGDSEGSFLNREERIIRFDSNRPVEEYIIEELLKGPAAHGNTSSIPQNVRLVSVSTENGICYVDFSSEFRNDGGSTNELFMIYSIVNSLTELSNVNKVRFLSEGGDIAEGERGFNRSMSDPFDRDDGLIRTVPE